MRVEHRSVVRIGCVEVRSGRVRRYMFADTKRGDSADAPFGRMTVSGPIAKLADIARGLTAVRRRRPQEQNRGVGIGSQVRRWLSLLVEIAKQSGRLFRPEFAPCGLRNACGNTMGRK